MKTNNDSDKPSLIVNAFYPMAPMGHCCVLQLAKALKNVHCPLSRKTHRQAKCNAFIKPYN